MTWTDAFAGVLAVGAVGTGVLYVAGRRRAAKLAALELREVVARIHPTLRTLGGRWNPSDDTRLVQSGAALEIGSLAEDLTLTDRRMARRAAEALHRYNQLSREADRANTGEARGETRRQAQECAWAAYQALERFR
jgi:uncharacterized protein YyaL (SSP411 family)